VQLTPSAALAFARSAEGKKMVRYTIVSVIAVIVSEAVLAFAFGVLHWTARSSNILATGIGTIPSYELNRKWAWGKRGKSHMWKEVVPFWTLSFFGLAFSTWSADYAETVVQRHHVSHGMQTLIVAAAALAAWGVLWVGKFIFFNKVLFRTHPQDLEPALDGRTGLPT
jgi:putative flippase GtrA